jgi:transposase-like protein
VPLQKRWRCRDCHKAFSVTSGTVFNCHKLSLQMLLGAMLLYVNSVKGMSALQLRRDLNVQ